MAWVQTVQPGDPFSTKLVNTRSSANMCFEILTTAISQSYTCSVRFSRTLDLSSNALFSLPESPMDPIEAELRSWLSLWHKHRRWRDGLLLLSCSNVAALSWNELWNHGYFIIILLYHITVSVCKAPTTSTMPNLAGAISRHLQKKNLAKGT